MSMTTATIETHELSRSTRRVKAKVGDLIQYWYQNGVASRALTTNRILEVADEGASFVVTGFFMVEAKNVVTVIPMHETKLECGDPVCEDAGRCVCEESW